MDLAPRFRPQFDTLNSRPSPSPSASPIPDTPMDDDGDEVETEYALTLPEERTVEKCFLDEKACESKLNSCSDVESQPMPWYLRVLTYIGAGLAGYLIFK